MKTLSFFLLITVLCVLTGCTVNVEQREPYLADAITIPFESSFMTSFTIGITDKGGDTELNSPVCHLEQFGSGVDAALGTFDIYLNCCWSLADGSHSCTEGFITDPDGNTLTFMCTDCGDGTAFTPDFPLDQTYLYSAFEFTGGTGRFAGASGSGLMQCEVKGASNVMIHSWQATLTMGVK